MRIPDNETADYHNIHFIIVIQEMGWLSGSVLDYETGKLLFDSTKMHNS